MNHSLSDAAKMLTGWDMLAVEKAFGQKLAELDSFTGYAIYWVLANRSRSESEQLSYKDVMGLSLGEVNDFFAEEDDRDPLETSTTPN